MKTRKNWFFMVIPLLLAGCSKDELAGPEPVQPVATVTDSTTAFKNKLLTDYAIVLARAVRQKELRTVIRDRAMLRFDGDYDVLVSRLENETLLEPGKTVRDYLVEMQTDPRLRSLGIVQTDSAYLKLTDCIPNVQVSVPVCCETWDPNTFVPLVAVLPYDYVEKPGNRIVAFDAEGKAYTLSADEEPGFPVLVVGRSERIDEQGRMYSAGYRSQNPIVQPRRSTGELPVFPEKLLLTHGYARSLLLEWTDVGDDLGYEIWRMSGTAFQLVAQTTTNDNSYVDANLVANQKYWYKVRALRAGGYSSWSPVMATTASSRSDNEWLKIRRMRFSSSALKAVEGWISGAPEIRLRVVQGSEGGATNVYTSGLLEPANRSDICDTWWYRDVNIFAWSTNVYGTVLTFDWREEDWLENVDFPLTGSYEDKQSGGTVKVGGSILIKNDPGGDVIGNTSVMWWQEKSQIYDLSGFQWQFSY
jgi:hypothetical protein